MAELAGKRVLIVGGTSGIGAALATRCAADGASVITASRRAEGHRDALTHHRLDVTDEAAVGKFLAAEQPFDHVAISAGGARAEPFRQSSTSNAMRAFDAKFWGAWRVAALAPLTDTASITFVSGVFAERPSPGNVAATCVNAALEALARGLAVEMGPVRVNAVSPGLVDTPMWQAMPADRREAFFAGVAGKLPARRICTADDVAALIVAAMTNPAMTGSVLRLDGGYVLV